MTRHDDIQAFRAQELLIKRATEGLDEHEAAELAALGADQDASFDLAAAAIDVATIRSIAELPAGVADRVLVAAGVAPEAGAPDPDAAYPTTLAGAPSFPPTTLAGVTPHRPSQPSVPTTLAGVTPARPIDTRASIGVPPPEQVTPPDELATRRERRSRVPMIAAYIAAAAGIALAIGAVLWARARAPEIRDRVVMPTTPPPAEARATLLATAKDVTTLAWSATADAAATGASGDIVWSQTEQKGFMRFVGLAVNDPKQVQYQLWIFDKTRDQAFPIDGGVFDIVGNEVIVPITAKLPVGEPVLFAVTVEKPGGVVVSKRERIVVTAAPKTG